MLQLLLLLVSVGTADATAALAASPTSGGGIVLPQAQQQGHMELGGGNDGRVAVVDDVVLEDDLSADRRRLSSFGRRFLTGTGTPPTTVLDDGWPAGVVVAQGGGGQFKTIGEALQAAPPGDGLYTVRVKAGIYNEAIKVTRLNVVLIGEGINRSIITGNKSNKTGTKMIDTATVTVLGHGFYAQDLTIRNTAGPEGRQALAYRSNSNKSALYRCSLEGYQDTVYAENNLQLYVECDISGTIDFIFGNAKAVFLGCRLLVRRPEAGQHNIITAQGRDNATHDSAFVFQSCRVQAMDGDNLTGVDTYLGRPWKEHSRVVFMNCYLGDVLNATGWVSWNKDKTVHRTTKLVRYLEYHNIGPKAGTAGRVKWKGVQNIATAAEATGYTADVFLDARSWVPRQIHYNSTLPAP